KIGSSKGHTPSTGPKNVHWAGSQSSKPQPTHKPGGIHNGGTHNGGTHNGGTHNGAGNHGGTHNGGGHQGMGNHGGGPHGGGHNGMGNHGGGNNGGQGRPDPNGPRNNAGRSYRGNVYAHFCFTGGWRDWTRRLYLGQYGITIFWCPSQGCWYRYVNADDVY